VRTFPNAFGISIGHKRTYRDREKNYLLHIGGYKRNKNLLPLLKAFSGLADEFPNWDVLLFSTLPNDRTVLNECLALVHQAGLAERIHFHEPTDDIEKEYRRADIHVITSLSEGCPNCVCEAMTHGLPTIGYADCAGTNSLVRHEMNGFLVPANSRVEGLREGLRRLMADAGLRQILGERAKADSLQFAPQRIYDHWESFFSEAEQYKECPERLLREQLDVEEMRARVALQARDQVLFKYRSLSNMFQ
jgi:glycosyltransferase involved in cell wall biosynthesis